MKKFLKLFFALSLLILALVACQKDKEKAQTEQGQTEQEQNYDYQEMLYVNNAGFNISGDLVIMFSDEIDKNQEFNKLIEVEGLDGDITIMPFGRKIIIKGDFQKEVPYSVKVSKGIKSVSGNELNEDYTRYNLYVGKKQPALAFADYGNVLPSVNNKKINFNSVNIKKVKLEIVKIYTNNITQYLKLSSNEYSLDWSVKEDIGDVVFSKEYEIESKEDEVVKNSIDLNGVIDTKGIYYVKLTSIGEESIDYDIAKYGEPLSFGYEDQPIYAKATKTIILSDIGIVANSNDSKLDIKLLNLNTLNPIGSAKLEFINSKNQTLEEGTTNSNGEYRSKVNLENVYYILVKSGNEFNVLYLSDSKINYADFDIGGSLEGSDLKLYTYTDKGYYRPGDEINVSLIARSKEKINDEHPFEYSFTAPDGSNKINNEVVKESKNGFYTFKIKTDVNDLNGAWTLTIKFGGKEVTQKVFIESKVANSIAIEADEDKIYSKADIKDGLMKFKFDFKYLSGAKLDKDSNVNFDYNVIEREARSKKYKNFVFVNPSNYKYQFRNFAETKTDDSGELELRLEMPQALQNKNLYLSTTVNVQDASGRYSTENKVFTIINRENSVGVQKLDQNGNEASVKYILLNEKTDSLVAGKKLKYRVYNKQNNWWYDYYEDDEKSFKENMETTLLEEGEITSASDAEILKVSSLADGVNFIEIEDEETGHSSGVFVYNYHYGDKKTGTIENLKASTDKEKYDIGDIAKIKYTGSIGSKALVTIEKDGKIIKEYWKTLTSTENEETIVIEKDFFPNAYVNISVFQKYVDKQNDRPLRLYASLPLMVEDKSKMLTIDIDTKTEVLPAGDLNIKLSNKEKKKMYYEVFLVDEGVLRKTDYKKPDPYKFFYEKRAKLVQNFDNFSNIIEKYSDKVMNRLKTGGGDYEELAVAEATDRAKVASDQKDELQLQGEAQRFKNLTIFRGVAESDENGNAELNIKVPNFFGQMRVFVVAVSDESYGSAEKSISVKAPVIVDSSAPRVLKVGDKFTVPVTLFPIEKAIGDSEVTLTYNGKTYSKKVNVKDGQNEKLLFELDAPDAVGTTKIDIDFKSSKYSFKDSIDLNVDTNYPYQYVEKSLVLEPNQEFTLSMDEYKDFINGSIKSNITLSSYPKLGIEKLIKSLMDYPYICLEQISSKGLSMLYIDKLTTDLVEKNDAKNEINTIIAKLNNNYQLRNGAFAYWPGSQEESMSTIYAIEFLIEAKERGYYIPEAMFENAQAYLNSIAMRVDIPKADVLYLLASLNDPNVSEMNIFFDRYYKDASLIDKWTLLGAYAKIGEKDFARKEAEKLPKKAETKDGIYYADQNAKILRYYTEIYGSPEPSLYSSVLGTAKSDEWLTTFEKAHIVQALAEGEKVSPEKKNLSFKLIVDGKEQNLELKDGEYTLKNLGIKENAKKIVIKNTSTSKLYVNSFVKGKPVKYEEKDESKNITITRRFVDMSGKEIDVKNLKAGTRFRMIISSKVDNNNLDDISLLQILPSGWEFDNSQAGAPQNSDPQVVPMNTADIDNAEYGGEMNIADNSSYTDMRDDRVAYFFPLYAGEDKEIEINLIAVTPGSYRLPGTKVESMYNKDFRAYLKGFEVKVSQ